jgi:hypothetical protein
VGVGSLVSQPPSLEEIFLRHYKLDDPDRQASSASTVSA